MFFFGEKKTNSIIILSWSILQFNMVLNMHACTHAHRHAYTDTHAHTRTHIHTHTFIDLFPYLARILTITHVTTVNILLHLTFRRTNYIRTRILTVTHETSPAIFLCTTPGDAGNCRTNVMTITGFTPIIALPQATLGTTRNLWTFCNNYIKSSSQDIPYYIMKHVLRTKLSQFEHDRNDLNWWRTTFENETIT